MTGNAAPRVRGGPSPASPAPFTTLVELTWIERKIEHWIRFGRQSYDQILDRRRRVVGFAPNSLFAFIRWASNDYGTIISRIDIVRAIDRGEPFQTLPFVRPGGDILLRLDGWPQGPARACRDRRGGSARPRSGRRFARSLAARS